MEMDGRAKEHWVAVSKDLPANDRPKHSDADPAVADARKRLLKIVHWSLNDDKHTTLEQIHETAERLQKIVDNVLMAPSEERFRRIRIANATFSRHVRDAPGGEEFMTAAGWRAAVRDNERYFVFEHRPGSVGWQALQIASVEIAKLKAVVSHKIELKAADKHAEEESRRKAVLKSLEDDKESRHLRFTYSDSTSPTN